MEVKESNTALADKTKTSIVGQVSLAGLALITAWQRDETRDTAWILVLLILLNLIRFLLVKIYPRFGNSDQSLWYKMFAGATFSTGVAWGTLCAYLLWARGRTDELTLLVIIMIAGLAAGATSTLTPDKNLARSFVLSLLVPSVCVLLYMQDAAYFSLGVIAILYAAFLIVQISVHSRILLELRSRQGQLQAFEEATMEAIVMHDRGLILEVNASFERMFGVQESDVVGRELVSFLPPEEKLRFKEIGFRDGNVPTEMEALRADGTRFHIEALGRWFNLEGRRVRISCLMDITSRKEAERAIEERGKIALETAKTKSEFLANMSHEIRTPLNAIIGITDLLTETATNDLQKKYFRTLKDSGESLMGLINDILDFSKIDENKMELEMVDFSLAAAVEGQVDLLANRARQKKISLQILLDPHIPVKVSGDYGRFGQVLLNLVSNAIKFTEKGSVRVSAKVMSVQDQSVRMRFEVKDTGAGISEESGRRLFKPFSQADSSTARKHGGTGLGLSISQKIVSLMGGEIGFDSSLGQGTTFWFEVPFPIVDSEGLAQAFARRPLNHKKVLVVTDQLSIQDVLSCYLDSWQFPIEYQTLAENPQFEDRVTIVCSGEPLVKVMETLKIRHAKQPQVIVLETQGQHAFMEDPLIKASLPLPLRYSDLYNAINESSVESFQKQTLPLEPVHEEFKSRRVLIAEDNTTNQMIILAFLKIFGLQCHTVNNGMEAVDAFSRGEYDMILMDCQMPELDGFEATERIRKLEEGRSTRIPIVALTANALKEDRDRCMAAGMDDFLTKPIRKDKLVHVLESYLIHRLQSS